MCSTRSCLCAGPTRGSGSPPGGCGASAATTAGGSGPCGSRSRLRLDAGLLVYWSWRGLRVDRRPLRPSAKAPRRLGRRPLGQARPPLCLDRRLLALVAREKPSNQHKGAARQSRNRIARSAWECVELAPALEPSPLSDSASKLDALLRFAGQFSRKDARSLRTTSGVAEP